MKKLLLALAFLFSISVMSFAQTSTASKKTDKEGSVKQSPNGSKKQQTTAGSTKKAPVASSASQKGAGPVKKDGTPDKRYKANKESKNTVHRKKDGTPDKRYKENKKKS